VVGVQKRFWGLLGWGCGNILEGGKRSLTTLFVLRQGLGLKSVFNFLS
jgi:hypothetical protein